MGDSEKWADSGQQSTLRIELAWESGSLMLKVETTPLSASPWASCFTSLPYVWDSIHRDFYSGQIRLALVPCQGSLGSVWSLVDHRPWPLCLQLPTRPLCFFLLNFSFPEHYNDEDPEKEKRIKELELLLMSTENELKGQQALPVSCHFFPCLIRAVDNGLTPVFFYIFSFIF